MADDARTLLGRLAGRGSRENGDRDSVRRGEYGETIDRAHAALDDLDAAAAFVDEGGLDRLEAAVAQAEADLSGATTRGREALRAYRAFQTVARGDDLERTGTRSREDPETTDGRSGAE